MSVNERAGMSVGMVYGAEVVCHRRTLAHPPNTYCSRNCLDPLNGSQSHRNAQTAGRGILTWRTLIQHQRHDTGGDALREVGPPGGSTAIPHGVVQPKSGAPWLQYRVILLLFHA
jgi:hypothetical protein